MWAAPQDVKSGADVLRNILVDRPSVLIEGRRDSYPAGTTVTGAGLSPAGTTHLCTAHLDQHTPFYKLALHCASGQAADYITLEYKC